MRIEKDTLGELPVPDNALYGIHSLRAVENFPNESRFHLEWFRAVAVVKQACYMTVWDYITALERKYPQVQLALHIPEKKIISQLIHTAAEMATGKYYDHFIVPAVQGGAGTSINMNINEILTNASLLAMGHRPGEYHIIDPVEDANVFQSTNDVIPTSLTVAAMRLFLELENAINELRKVIEQREKESRHHLRVGYTQMQEAVPVSIGRQFGVYNEALSRDWWRVSKCIERLKPVNLGGGATGTGLAIPRYYIMNVVAKLRHLTGLPLGRSMNLMDATSNLDHLVEVHAIIKSHAVNLEKIVSDLRLLASDIHETREIHIPPRQVGSSIMPGKINPVIPEFVISCSHKVYANDQLITALAGQGCLELNAYIPLIGHALLESLKLMIAANLSLKENMLKDLKVNSDNARRKLFSSSAITTALVPYIGYNLATRLSLYMKKNQTDIFKANEELKLIDPEKLKQILSDENLLKEGFIIGDILPSTDSDSGNIQSNETT